MAGIGRGRGRPPTEPKITQPDPGFVQDLLQQADRGRLHFYDVIRVSYLYRWATAWVPHVIDVEWNAYEFERHIIKVVKLF